MRVWRNQALADAEVPELGMCWMCKHLPEAEVQSFHT